MRFLILLLTVMTGLVAMTGHAQASGLYSRCDTIAQARSEMPLLFVSTGCTGTVQDRIYGATAAIGGGNAQSTAALLGMVKIESGCGNMRSAGSVANGCGVYTIANGTTSAEGTTQILDGTWTQIVTSTATRNQMLSKLGPCPAGTVRPGSLLDPARTHDGVIRAQFIAFHTSLCGGGGRSVTDKDYWNGMVGVSILAADAYDSAGAGRYMNNAALSSNLTALGVNSNAITRYAVHNLGPGDGAKLLGALSSNPNQSVGNFLSSTVMNNNPGIYCAGGRRPCSPVSAAQAARNMQTTMFSGTCVSNGLRANNLPITASDMPVQGGTEAVCREGPTDTRDGTMICGTSGPAAVSEMGLDKGGGLAGRDNPDALYSMDGASRPTIAKVQAGVAKLKGYAGPAIPLTARKTCPNAVADGTSKFCTDTNAASPAGGVAATATDGPLKVDSQ